MTQVDPALVAAVVAVLQAQGVAVIAPSPTVAQTRQAWCCRRCGIELSDTSWPTYASHMAANHQPQLIILAQTVQTDDQAFVATLTTAEAPEDDGHAAAVTALAEQCAGLGWPAATEIFIEQRELPV